MIIISNAEIKFEEKKRNNFNPMVVDNALNELLKKPLKNHIKESQLKNALRSVMWLIHNNKLLTDKNHKQFSLESYNPKKFMHLDFAAIRALSIFPNTMDNTMNGNATLLGLLNKCKTQIGSRCLEKWIKQPLQHVEEIIKRHDCVENLINDKELLNHLENKFFLNIPDLDKLSAKFYQIHSQKNHNGSLSDCVKVYQIVQHLKRFCQFLNDKVVIHVSNGIRKHFLSKLKINLNSFEDFEETIKEKIDMENTQDREYLIKSSNYPKLSEINKELKRLVVKMKSQKKIVQKDFNNDVNLVDDDSNKYIFLFEYTKKEGDDLKTLFKSYKIISRKGSKITFTSKELMEIIADYAMRKNEYKEQQKEIVLDILNIVSKYYVAIEGAASLIAELDCIAAFAYTSMNASPPYTRPNMKTDGSLILNNCRHPYLAFMDSDRKTIPNDCEMYKYTSILHLITGPNMGGKSTYIRTVAIVVLLAHIGCFVPCSLAKIPIIDAILTRVGSSDMQSKGISTFESEMLETSSMLNIATKNSLLIVDELGRGTSTSDGFGLSWGMAEYIAKVVKGYCLFVTHFHELADMESQIEGVKNFHVSGDISNDGKLTMLYKIKPGAMNYNYGLFVAEMLNLPTEIIEDAKQKAKEFESYKDQDDEDIEDNEDYITEINNATLCDDFDKGIERNQKRKVITQLSNAMQNQKNGDDDNLLSMCKKILFDFNKN